MRRHERRVARREALHHRVELQSAHAVVLDRRAHDALRVGIVDVHAADGDHVRLPSAQLGAEAVQLLGLAGPQREQQVHDALRPGGAQVGQAPAPA